MQISFVFEIFVPIHSERLLTVFWKMVVKVVNRNNASKLENNCFLSKVKTILDTIFWSNELIRCY